MIVVNVLFGIVCVILIGPLVMCSLPKSARKITKKVVIDSCFALVFLLGIYFIFTNIN